MMISTCLFNGSRIRLFHNTRTSVKDGPDDKDL